MKFELWAKIFSITTTPVCAFIASKSRLTQPAREIANIIKDLAGFRFGRRRLMFMIFLG